MKDQKDGVKRKKINSRRLTFARLWVLVWALVSVCTACGQGAGNGADRTAQESAEDKAEEVSYTYRTAISDFPTNWSPASAQTAADAQLMRYLTASLYGFDYNEAMDGCVIKPSAAAGLPVDVTASYAQRWGIEPGETGRVWSIPLRDDVKWEDGSRITADSYEKSVQMILDPAADNLRAGMFYDDSFCLIGAAEYQKGGRFYDLSPMIGSGQRGEYIQTDEFDVGEDGIFSVNGKTIVLDLSWGSQWGVSLGERDTDGLYVNADGVNVYREILMQAMDVDGMVPVSQKIYDAACFCIAAYHGYGSIEEYAETVGNYAYLEAEKMCFFASRSPKLSFSEVGITAVSDHELVIALERPLEAADVCYALTDGFLIKESLYLECERFRGGYSNTYGTSAETTASCGPYRLESFSGDGEFVLVRNEHYFDLYRKYQTTRCVVQCVRDPEQKKELFLNGQIDTYRLTADDTKTVAGSEYTYYAPGTASYFVAMNPDAEILMRKQDELGEGYNKTILTVKEFRQALSYALDRYAFIMAAAPNRQPLIGLFSDRRLQGAGEDGFAYTREERDMLEEITGFDMEKAKEYFSEAYRIALQRGILSRDDIVRITIGVPDGSSVFYRKGYDFLTQCWIQAAVDTPFEGKLVFEANDTLGNEYAAALRSGEADILFGVGFEGAALDPYRMMRYYAADEYFRYNSYRDPREDRLTIRLEETDYTASVAEWAQALVTGSAAVTDRGGRELTYRLTGAGTGESAEGGETADSSGTDQTDGNSENGGVTGSDRDLRPQVLKALERSVLETYELLPLMDDFTVQICGKKIQYPTKDYVQGMGFGGLAYYTYNYSDAEWEAYVANHDGALNYE